MPTTDTQERVKIRKASPIAFRLDQEYNTRLQERFQDTPIVGITSSDMFARKLVMDVLTGRAMYLNPEDASKNPALS
jgi:hypothetical protein